ncbi:MAG: NlpC/P60 family protein [Verrucomicrobiota bacterium]
MATALMVRAAEVASIQTGDLADYAEQPAPVRELIDRALQLTRMDLGYRYGSADPKKGGMDCSGTINYLLRADGFEHVPRQANQMYVWAWKAGGVTAVASSRLASFEFDRLRPGDLLFWSGTYDVDREPPVTHVMLYLGRLKDGGRRVMFGASSGRRYAGRSRHGVSVFDLELPRPGSKSRFIGYAPIPGMAERIRLAAEVAIPTAPAAALPASAPAAPSALSP